MSVATLAALAPLPRGSQEAPPRGASAPTPSGGVVGEDADHRGGSILDGATLTPAELASELAPWPPIGRYAVMPERSTFMWEP